MGDRSDEATVTRDASTEELLEETERLLSNEEGSEDASAGTGTEPAADAAEGATTEASGSRLRGIGSRPSISKYFSARSFLALALILGAGMLAGGFAIPIAGRLVGLFAVAFLFGLVASRRRYLEVSLAGVSIGGIGAVLNHMILTVAGSGTAVVAVGASAGLAACVGGYYFGRDLRNGLVRDVE